MQNMHSPLCWYWRQSHWHDWPVPAWPGHRRRWHRGGHRDRSPTVQRPPAWLSHGARLRQLFKLETHRPRLQSHGPPAPPAAAKFHSVTGRPGLSCIQDFQVSLPAPGGPPSRSESTVHSLKPVRVRRGPRPSLPGSHRHVTVTGSDAGGPSRQGSQ